MSYFTAKKHQIRFRLGLCSRPRWGAYSVPPDLLAGFKRPTSKGREGKGGEGKEWDGTGGEESGKERREGEGKEGSQSNPPLKNLRSATEI